MFEPKSQFYCFFHLLNYDFAGLHDMIFVAIIDKNLYCLSAFYPELATLELKGRKVPVSYNRWHDYRILTNLI